MSDDALDNLAELMSLGLSPAEAIDFLATIEYGYSQGEWADVRGVGRQAVNKNVMQAKQKLATQ